MYKYKFEYDEQGYIVSFYSVLDDDYDYIGDISNIDVSSGWFKFVNGELVEDLDKKAQVEDKIFKEEEIYDLEQKLNSTDYIMSRMVEELMELDNPLTFITDTIKIFVAYGKKYKEQIANRKIWRARIEELRGE